MGYIPIFLDVTGRRCVVVGGGEVAARKVESLLASGAQVIVVSPTLAAPALNAAVDRGMVEHIARAYRRGDIAGCALAYAATDDRDLHRALAEEARALGIPLNVVDVPELCSFIAPAVVRQGALQIAISTGGASPAFAARVRRLKDLAESPLLDAIRARDPAEVDRILALHLGDGIDLAALEIDATKLG